MFVKQKIELEKNFSDAKDEKIYTEYDHLLKLIENYENLYLKILELQEQLD